MAKVRSWVGLDVHARWVLAVTIDGESGELRTRRLSGKTGEVVEFCSLLLCTQVTVSGRSGG